LLHLTPAVHTFTLHEVWATDQDNDIERVKKPRRLYQTVTKSLLEQLQASPLTADAFSSQLPLLPKLKSLTLRVREHFDADQAFVDLVRSRWFHQTDDLFGFDIETLRTVELHVFDRVLPADVYELLKRIEEDGMMISVFEDRL
ncbi:hypothetical protein L218DRAFT_837725, partial [Marasmius fiardii PR-910]